MEVWYIVCFVSFLAGILTQRKWEQRRKLKQQCLLANLTYPQVQSLLGHHHDEP